MRRHSMLIVATLLLAALPLQAFDRKKMVWDFPEMWTIHRGNRIQEELPYLADTATKVLPPLHWKIDRGAFVVYDRERGDLLRLTRVKDYILVDVHPWEDPTYRGRILVGATRFYYRDVGLFFGEKIPTKGYILYSELRAFHHPEHDFFPVVVVRRFEADKGVVYLDPLATGEPQAIVNFSSVPVKD